MATPEVTLTQTDGIGGCTTGDFCADPGSVRDVAPAASAGVAVEGGTAGTTEYTTTITASSVEHGTFYECNIKDEYTWLAGAWEVQTELVVAGRFPITGLFYEDVYICRINNVCANQETIGSATPHSTVANGTKVTAVTGIAQAPVVGDDIMIVVVYDNTTAFDKSFGVKHSKLILTPFINFNPITIGGGWGVRRPECSAGVFG